MHRALFVCALASGLTLDVATAQNAVQFDSASVLITSGTGTLSVRPDRADLSFNVESPGQTAAAASSANSASLRALLSALNAIRQPAESIQVIGVTLRPNLNYQTGVLRDYVASAAVRVALRDLTRLSRFMDVALASGATSVSNVHYDADSSDALQRTALARAFADASANAEAIAHAAGARLGPLLRVSTSPAPEERSFGFGVARLESVTVTEGPSIAPRDIILSATVYTTWRLVPQR